MTRRPPRRCLDCGAATTKGSRCAGCQRRANGVRNADRPIARAVVAASPVCAKCGSTEDLTADHVLALANGGTNHGRRQTLCRPCNSRKADR